MKNENEELGWCGARALIFFNDDEFYKGFELSVN